MNKQISKLLNVTEEDYVKWCRANKRAAYKKSSRREFLNKVQKGKLVRNEFGNLVKIEEDSLSAEDICEESKEADNSCSKE